MLAPIYSLIIALATSLTSFLATWLVRGVMRRAGIMDVPHSPGGRKTHRAPVAYEGGLAMYAAFVVGLLVAAYFQPAFFFEEIKTRGLLIGATAVVALGVADDLLDLRPVMKLLAQLAVGGLMYHYGFGIDRITNPFGQPLVIWSGFSLTATMLWYALLMNGINMIDGLDGLAAGICCISGVTICAIAADLRQGETAFAVALIISAMCAGFLPFNFSPATIFMGDAGSLLLGFLLASVTLSSSAKAPGLLAMIIPVIAVGLPIFETVFAFVRRLLQGQHPFRADRRHLHHRLLALGLSERRTVLIFYYLTAYFGVAAYILQRLEAKGTLALVVIILAGMLLLIENMRYLEKRSRRDQAS